MRQVPAIALLLFFAAFLSGAARAEDLSGITFKPLQQVLPDASPGSAGYDFSTGTFYGTNILFQQNNATLMADSVTYNPQSGIAIANGHVCLEQAGQMWIGDHIVYNTQTHLIESGKFRSGKRPFYVQGKTIQGDVTNRTYGARNFYVTTDDVTKPDYYIGANRVTFVPGKYVEAWNAVLYVKGVPLFYFPYFRHSLTHRPNNLTFMPGDDSLYGPYLLGTYRWRLGDELGGRFHLDYREKRGVGAGPDFNLHLGQWGDAQFEYYYLHDLDPNESINDNSQFQNLGTIPKDRQRFYLGWQAMPVTNVETRALVNYQSDQLLLHDFFQSDYGQNPQPNTFVEVDKHWNNWSADVETMPRVNSFFDQVERLPDLQVNGFRQQIFNTPFYYESQSSVGYYERYFADTNTLFGATNGPFADYSAARADTFHQLLLPETLFGWLNVTPHAGARATWYGPTTWYGSGVNPGDPTNSQETRIVFNTGVDASLKASRLWPTATNRLLDVDGLRHIIVPSISYVYVPSPNLGPTQVPQFDTQLPNLMLLPVDFPDYNDIDSIESENVIRFGLRNTLQTMRNGQLDPLLDWNLMLDWNLHPNGQTNGIFLQPQKTFDDLYSALAFKPRPWLALNSRVRYDINDSRLNMAFDEITFSPNDRWSWAIGHWYLHDGFVDSGDDVITSTLFYRLSDNWGIRATHYFNAETGHLQEQYYTLYRDMRSWTAAVTFRLIDNGGGQPVDYGFAFSLSLKAYPRYHVGDDTIQPYDLLGE